MNYDKPDPKLRTFEEMFAEWKMRAVAHRIPNSFESEARALLREIWESDVLPEYLDEKAKALLKEGE